MTTQTTTHFTDTKEFHDLRDDFERTFKISKSTREIKESWKRGYFYTNGVDNNLFKGFLHGYQLGRLNYMH